MDPVWDSTFDEVRAQPGSPPRSPSSARPPPPTRPIGHHQRRPSASAAGSSGDSGSHSRGSRDSGLLGGGFVTISSPTHHSNAAAAASHSPSFSASTRPLSYASAHPLRDPPTDDERPPSAALTLRPRSPTPAQARAAAARARSKSPLPQREAQQAFAAEPPPVRNVAQSPRVDGHGLAAAAAASSKSSSSAASAAQQRHAVEPIPKPLKPLAASFPSAASAASSASASAAAAAAGSGSASSKSSAIRAAYQKPSEPVFLNVYDLHPYNQYLHGLGFGAYHSAVQIFGREYSFGFHNSSDTGVFSMAPMNVPNAVFREQIAAGEVYLTLNQFNLILSQLKQEWRGNQYHLLKKNCNHFSKQLLSSLGLKAPSFINRLAAAGDMLAAVVPSFMLPKQVNLLIATGRPDLGAGLDDEDEKQEAPLRNVPSGRSGQQGAGGVPTLGGGFRNISDSGSRASNGEGNWRQIAPQMSPDDGLVPDITAAQADDMDDQTFAEFLRASEREYAREVELKRLRAETQAATERHEQQRHEQQQHAQQPRRAPASASPSSGPAAPPGKLSTARQDSEGRSSAREELLHGYSRLDVPDRPNHHGSHASPISSPGRDAAHARRLSGAPVSPEELDARIDRAMQDFSLSSDVSKAELAQIRAVLRISMTAGAQ